MFSTLDIVLHTLAEHCNLIICNPSLTSKHSLIYSFMQTFTKYLLDTGHANLSHMWSLPPVPNPVKEAVTNGWLQRSRLKTYTWQPEHVVLAAIRGMDAIIPGLCRRPKSCKMREPGGMPTFRKRETTEGWERELEHGDGQELCHKAKGVVPRRENAPQCKMQREGPVKYA